MGVNISGNILMGTLGGPPRVTKYNGIGPISVVSGTSRWYPEINGKSPVAILVLVQQVHLLLPFR